jgi:hypothetical protein
MLTLSAALRHRPRSADTALGRVGNLVAEAHFGIVGPIEVGRLTTVLEYLTAFCRHISLRDPQTVQHGLG